MVGALLVGGLLTPSAQAAEDDAKLTLTKAQSLTGTRLKHANVGTGRPATIYTREDILRSGESNTADFIRSLAVNSFGSFRPQPGSTIQENAFVSMRGLGASRTLILIDGHRMPKSPTSAVAANLNLIPMGAIERIEILTESASAIYGTDAIAGVINVITRTDFQGAEIMLGAGNPSIPKNGGETEYGSVVFGTSSERSSLVAGVSWNQREIVFERDVPWREIGRSIYGNSFTTLSDGYDNFDWTSYLGACDYPNSAFYTIENTASLNGTRCAYDFSLDASEDASTENKAFYINANHELNDKWLIEAKTLFSQAESFGRYAPVPDSSYFSTPLTSSSPNNPTNPNSPLYDPSLDLEPQAVNWWHRFDALGNRDRNVKSQLLDMRINVLGQIGSADVELGIRHTDNRSADVGKNYLLRSAAQALIEDGSYSLLNPYAASENVLNAMRFTTYRDAKFDQDELFANVAFDLFKLKGGAARILIGAEYLAEKYFDLDDPQSQSEQVGGTAGASAFANRDTKSVFFESHVPIFQQLSIDLAGRYDDYSDLGDDLAGKISLFYQPFEQLSFYSSFSNDHQAPNLKVMNRIDSTSFTSVRTYVAGCEFIPPCILSIIDTLQANPFLESEQSNQLNFVVNYKPKSWIDLSVKYWDLEIDNRIRLFGAQEIISNESNGETNPLGLGCTRSPTGLLIQCITGYGNQGTLEMSGLDFHALFDYPLLNGTMNHKLMFNHILDLQDNDGNPNQIDSPGYPKQRAAMYNNYNWKNWSLAYDIHMVGSQAGEFAGSTPAPTWVTHDVQLSYQLPWRSQITVGVKNIGEKFPPINAGRIGNRAYDFSLYDGFGRIVYARYTQTF
jgi:iron complex outermembrane receptor protein